MLYLFVVQMRLEKSQKRIIRDNVWVKTKNKVLIMHKGEAIKL